jgi:hypothetical protein
LPSIVASMQLTIEVLDTFCPGRTNVDDEIDAMAFNNKYFVWAKEAAPVPFSRLLPPPSDPPTST